MGNRACLWRFPPVPDQQSLTVVQPVTLTPVRGPVAATPAATEPESGSSPPSASPGDELKGYVARASALIYDAWRLPPELGPEQLDGLVARIMVAVQSDGTVTSEVRRRSGNAVFDEACARTVRAAGPLPPLPAAARQRSIAFEMVVRGQPRGPQRRYRRVAGEAQRQAVQGAGGLPAVCLRGHRPTGGALHTTSSASRTT